ncbi:MAG: transketolase [Candidatus Doudnabacteria bacterium RIFCSPHIGHO2_01_52_17]|uniref:Transketolase n=1 Tax=Candidatus Doudnabacteria bacterium RIFCSPHIGHO2_01_52_17 TaxID=1817820 RepID=A0A1F5NE67_9BACT|nr:MAG: Transketolase [Parcubacteria group bacterium GW2011_GWA2_52_8]OGE75946.1 MAG: transketolase [Candidatus Doudnabacteria bacterium RIFCSPHIGHO2_01_52_17]
MMHHDKFELKFVPISQIKTVQDGVQDPVKKSELLADIFRINTLSMIMQAGSGHLGTSFSCMDILTWLWTEVLKNPNQKDERESDTFFSSKGHDAPALYSVLIGLGKLEESFLHKLRRLDGLPGHPDIHTPYIAANTGSLGMGISKARGMATANRLSGKKGRFYILTGDGELQEGQIWESLAPVASRQMSEITVIIDHNKLQSDIEVRQVSDLGNLEDKFRSFGWEVFRVDGHDFVQMSKIIDEARRVKDKPQVIIADTIKGKGSSVSVAGRHRNEDELYNFHAGAPSPENYEKILAELTASINAQLSRLNLGNLEFERTEIDLPAVLRGTEKLVAAYGEELAKLGGENENIVVLDGDLMKDTGLIQFKKQFPERFFECGIAEQDMVSMAGGLALRGKLPIVHSFACFLSTRPNEQIYNNATEETKIIYVGSLAGLLPAAPGHSHQSVRDISALGSTPGLTMIEPSSELETRLALRWAVENNPQSTYIRLVSLPRELPYELPRNYKMEPGRGVKLVDGKAAAVFAYGPVMLAEAVKAAAELKIQKISVAVYNLPWLNQIDKDWLLGESQNYKSIFTIDDHYLKFGQGSMIAAAFSGTGKKVVNFGLDQIPACGQVAEVLEFHGLDANSLARKIKSEIGA